MFRDCNTLDLEYCQVGPTGILALTDNKRAEGDLHLPTKSWAPRTP